MIPEVGSEWLARDGRRMRVEEILPKTTNTNTMIRMTVLNATGRMKKKTQMHPRNFGDDMSAFLQPAQ